MYLLERSTSIVFPVGSLSSFFYKKNRNLNISQIIFWVCHLKCFQNKMNIISSRQSKFNSLSLKSNPFIYSFAYFV